MRLLKTFAGMALAAGLTLPGSLMAQDWGYRDNDHGRFNDRDRFNERQDIRRDYQHIGNDYANLDAMRADIARDRVRLNEDIRFGNSYAAAEDARDLARDQQALNAQLRDIRHDQADVHYDRRDLHRDNRFQWQERFGYR